MDSLPIKPGPERKPRAAFVCPRSVSIPCRCVNLAIADIKPMVPNGDQPAASALTDTPGPGHGCNADQRHGDEEPAQGVKVRHQRQDKRVDPRLDAPERRFAEIKDSIRRNPEVARELADF